MSSSSLASSRHPFLLILLTAMTYQVAAAPSMSESASSKPVTLVVSFPPGGTADTLARQLAKPLGEELGQAVVVVNRSGASGTIGATSVANAPADGSVLLFGTSNEITMSPHLYRSLPYGPTKSFSPIGAVVTIPNVLVVGAGLGVNDLTGLLSRISDNPASIAFANAGPGSINHLTAELFAQQMRFPVLNVAYRGGAPAMTDVSAGHVQAMFATMPSALALIASGRLKALAVTSAARSSALPDIPTFAETSAGSLVATTWAGVLAPAGLPAETKKSLVNALKKAAATAEFKKAIVANGVDALSTYDDDFKRMLEEDSKRWGALIDNLAIPKQ